MKPPAPWFQWILLALLLGYGIFIGMNFAPVAAGADSGGYLGSARLFTQGRLTTPLRTVPEFDSTNSWTHTPLGYEKKPGYDILKPTYPPGLPLHYAAGGLVAGWYWGPLLVGVLGALAAVAGCYLCLRELEASPVLAAAGAGALAVSPIFLFTSFIPMSDTIATAWCGGAFLAALRARRGRHWALACGVAFSIAVLVRPANVILLPALTLVLWNWRNLLWAGLGALPGAIGNASYNRAIWGGALHSGYGEVIYDVFSRVYFRPSLVNYIETLPFALPLMFIGLLLLPLLPWRQRPREMGGALLWAVSFMLFYAFYKFTQQAWWFLRFLLPAFPALVILAICGLEGGLARLADRRRQAAGIIAAGGIMLLSVGGSIHVARERNLMLQKEYQQPYVAVCEWAQAHMPPGSLIACMQTSSAFYFYTDFPILRWDATDPGPFASFKVALQRTGRPFYAVLFPFEQDAALKVRLPGRWQKMADVKGVGIWKFDPTP